MLSNGNSQKFLVISGFRRDVCENCTFVSYYAASSGNFLPIGCPEMSVRNNHCSMRNNPEELGYHEILVEQPERMRPLGSLKYKLEKDI
jgi:hypothetical protein